MATTDLGKWMITNGGEYNPDTTYEQLTMVLYENSTYITLRTVTGITPNNDKINYILMAQGFSANALADVVAKDTYGAIGNVGESVSAQSLIDYLTNEVVNNLIKKTSISTVQVNSDDMVPSSSLAYSMQLAINDLNSNLGMKITSGNITDIIGALPVGKYAGYYSSGATGTPSSYGTFEAIVMNDSTATITAINTSNGDEFVRIRTSNNWNDWVQNIVKSTNKTSLQSPDKTHTLGIHNNGTAYLDDNKVITSKDMYAISLSTDLNTVKSPGTYVQTANSGATTALHYPVTTAGFLEVIGRTDSDWILQRYTPWDTSTQTYKRTFYQGSWRDWVTT